LIFYQGYSYLIYLLKYRDHRAKIAGLAFLVLNSCSA
jgi:hypothetical protein